MAVAFVRGKWTGGAAAASEVVFAAEPAAGNMLAAFIHKSTEPNTAPKVSDDKDGETGWTVHATHALSNTSGNGLWVAYKPNCKGTEKNIKATGGTIQGVAYAEVSGLGASPTVDSIEHVDNQGSSKEGSITYTTSNTGSITFVGWLGANSGGGTAEAWTGTGPTLTNPETASGRTVYGYAVPGTAVSAKTAIFHHETSRPFGLLQVSFAPASETKTVTQAKASGAGAPSVSSQKVATPTATVKGAGQPTASALKIALATAQATGAGRASASTVKVATPTALVHGAGAATVSITPQAEVKIVTALVHGGGQASASASRTALITALVTGGGAVGASALKIALVVPTVTGGGRAVVGASRVASATAFVHGGGAATVTLRAAAIIALVHGGGNAHVILRGLPTPSVPTGIPFGGHVAQTRSGRVAVARPGRVATGRAEP